MKLINRIALIVTPQAPMLEWIKTLDEEQVPTLQELQQESSTYLLDEPTQEQPLDLILQQLITEHYGQVWRSEMAIWDEFLDNAPADMDLATFKTWFNVSLSGLTFDLSSQQLMSADVDSI